MYYASISEIEVASILKIDIRWCCPVTRNLNAMVKDLVVFTSAGIGVVEFQFFDPEDGISEWTYVFAHKFGKEERMKLGVSCNVRHSTNFNRTPSFCSMHGVPSIVT
jgi:hypothetical protein